MGLFKRRDHQAPNEQQPPQPTTPPPPAPTGAQGMDLEALMLQAQQLSTTFRRQGAADAGVRDLTEFARQAQAQAQAQMAAAQQAQTSGGGIGAVMTALGMQYSSDYVKRVECPSCGGPKRLPSPSAYIYCDYCGALADYDFRRACEDSNSALPGPQYMQLVNGSQPELNAAKAAGDVDHYRAVQQRIFDAYVTYCPKACSHRIGDPAYRTQLVRYMAESSVVNDFDPEYAALMNEMRSAVGAMQWTGGLMARRTGGASFRALVDICERQLVRTGQIAAATRVTELDPDQTAPVVRNRMYHSLFAQGWLPMLDSDDAAWLITEFELAGEYTKIEPAANGETRNCGGCGGNLVALPGATAVVCDHCGRSIDVAGAQCPCGGCGAQLSFPRGVNRLPCPYCQTGTERIGWT